MRFSYEIKYDAAPADVYAMLSETSFRERVCEAGGATEHAVEISPSGSGMEVLVDQTQPADGIPSFATKFVGDKIQIVQRESWNSQSEAALDVTIPGKPGHVKGSVTLAADGSGTLETVEGEVKVHIPLIGGKLESLIADLLKSALRSEQKVGEAWLDGSR